MSGDYVPKTDTKLLQFVQNYSTIVTAGPTALGLTTLIATTLAGKVSSFATALTAATDPPTRGGATVFLKDNVRDDLVTYIRQITRTVQGTPTVTDQQKFDLGVTVRSAPSPAPVPGQARATVVSSNGNIVRIRISDPDHPDRRGRPDGVVGIAIFSHVGETAPNTPDGWTFQGNASLMQADVEFPTSTAPGAKVWFTCFFFNQRKQAGLAAVAVSTNLPGGAAMVV